MATVSRCLNSPERVVAETRNRVSAAIQKLGYVPNFGARALVARQTKTLGAIIPTLNNAIFARFIETLQLELSSAGRTLLLASSGYDPVREQEQIETLILRGVDGVMLTGEMRTADAYALLKRRGVRYVNTYVHHPGSSNPTIGFDNHGAMEQAVNYLYDQGHRTIAMIGGITADNDRARERITGAEAFMKAKGLGLSRPYLLEREYEISAGRDGLRHLMALPKPPTAVMCGNDVLAIGAMIEANALGIEVPTDLSIIGFDDLDLATEFPPGLTTIHAPLEEMGRRTAQYLIGDNESQGNTPHVELPTALVVRGSTGPAPTR